VTLLQICWTKTTPLRTRFYQCQCISRYQDSVAPVAEGGLNTGVCAGENMLDSEETMMADEIWSSSWAGQLLDRCL
jgi:hypothetical protein